MSIKRPQIYHTESGVGDLLADGTIPLTANWDVGAFDITAEQFHSDVTVGTPPFTVVSTTVVTNLNADKLDGADLIDEDNMASDSAVHVPTQQSVKAYVDAAASGGNATFASGEITTTSNSLSGTFVLVTGSDVAVEAGKTYAISWRLAGYAAVNTTGVRLQRVLGSGAAGSVLGWTTIGVNSNVGLARAHPSREGTNDVFPGGDSMSNTTSNRGAYAIDCLFVCTTSGTLGVELATNTGGSSVTIDGDGSYWTAVSRTT